MAFAKKCGSDANEGFGMGLVRSTSFGRKRVALSNVGLEFVNDDDCSATTPPKKHCLLVSPSRTGKSALEDLPQEILIRILCGVEHDDLKRLCFVSKTIRDATLIAKQSHFAYSTPRKTVGFQSVDYFGDFIEVEVPNAPKQSRVPRSRLSAKKLADISVALFASGDEDGWPRSELFMRSDTEI